MLFFAVCTQCSTKEGHLWPPAVQLSMRKSFAKNSTSCRERNGSEIGQGAKNRSRNGEMHFCLIRINRYIFCVAS